MITIERTGELRSAFLKIGWAPLVTIIGIILLCVIAIVIGVGTISDLDDSLAFIKTVMVGSSLISLLGYFLNYLGFSQAQKAFGRTEAGDAVSTMKIIFLIFSIIGALTFLVILLVPDTTKAYADIANHAAENIAKARTFGVSFFAVSILMSIYSIVALFIIKSKTKKLAAATNIKSLQSAATGALLGVITFFASLVSGFISGMLAAENGDSAIALICQLFTLGIAIYALVKWIGGWLGAASEVMRHEVEVEDYTE